MLISIVDKCIIQIIQEQSGVEKLVNIINKKVVEAYQQGYIDSNDRTLEKALLYLKYLPDYEVFEETYRASLSKRYSNMYKLSYVVVECSYSLLLDLI
jgi:hypothetical protein